MGNCSSYNNDPNKCYSAGCSFDNNTKICNVTPLGMTPVNPNVSAPAPTSSTPALVPVITQSQSVPVSSQSQLAPASQNKIICSDYNNMADCIKNLCSYVIEKNDSTVVQHRCIKL